MNSSIDIWKMLAGIAFFLLAMKFMENALRLLAGRPFKLFLKRQTDSKLKAIAGGAIVTGLLQSSSIANLLVLSMVGAGVLKMENALALMLGSNLGSTLNSWLIASLGFNFNIENFALPVVAITGIFMAFIANGSKWFLWFKFFFGLAFLFVGLGYIRAGMEGLVSQTDLTAFTKYPAIVFLLLGIVLTTIVQSSSATIAITLSALHTNVITLYIAMAIVLGSEIGTTLKLFLAAANGIAVKKRVALGNFLFNFVIVIIVFLLLRPINHLLIDMLKIKDNLIALVFFQSIVNLGCILLFFPLLNLFGKYLTTRYSEKEEKGSYISKMAITDNDLAMEALENETKNFINHVIYYSLESFGLKEDVKECPAVSKIFQSRTIADKYDYIKQLHGKIHNFYLKLSNEVLNKSGTTRLDQVISAIRNSMYAAKSIRDVQLDIEQTRNSSNDIKYNFYIRSREKLLNFYKRVLTVLNEKPGENSFEELTLVYQSLVTGYLETLHFLYKESLANHVNEIEISTLINFNRELYSSFKSILFSLKDYLLTVKEAEYFDAQPGFIR